MILLIDNYDSFVHNLGRYIGRLGKERSVIRRDHITLEQINILRPEAIIISPGPCAPKDSGISMDVIKRFGAEIPILGICLGHQCIGKVYGGQIIRSTPCHGKASAIHHNEDGLFKNMPQGFMAGRYHSLAVALDGENPLEITARTDDGIIMGLQHKTYPVYGLQFHPESILTEQGETLLSNFVELAEQWHRSQSAPDKKKAV